MSSYLYEEYNNKLRKDFTWYNTRVIWSILSLLNPPQEPREMRLLGLGW